MGKNEGPEKDPAVERLAYRQKVMNPSTYGVTPGPIADPLKLADVLMRLRSGGVNLLGPECHIDCIQRNHVISLRWLFFDRLWPAPAKEGAGNGVWYPQKGGGFSLNWPSLNQLAGLAGVQWVHFRRDDDGSMPLYWRFHGRCEVRYFDGSTRYCEEPVESDLRDGSAEAAEILSGTGGTAQLAKARAKGSRRAASIGKAALLRELFGLRQKFSQWEADQPFVWPALVFMPPADPELDRLLAMREMGLVGELYGRPRTVVDIEAAPERAALPAPSDAPPRDFTEESRRLNARERVPVEDDEPDEDEHGTPLPPPGSGLMERRDDPPPRTDPEPPPKPERAPNECVTCGKVVGQSLLDWTKRMGLEPLCHEHAEAAHAKRGGS